MFTINTDTLKQDQLFQIIKQAVQHKAGRKLTDDQVIQELGSMKKRVRLSKHHKGESPKVKAVLKQLEDLGLYKPDIPVVKQSSNLKLILKQATALGIISKNLAAFTESSKKTKPVVPVDRFKAMASALKSEKNKKKNHV